MDINTKKLKKNAFRVSKVRGLTASRVRVPGGCCNADVMQQVVDIARKYGNGFEKENYQGKELIVVAGGTGVSPVRGVISYFGEHPDEVKKLHTILGFKSPSDILFREDLKIWEQQMELILTVDSADDDSYRTGLVTKYIPELELDNIHETAAIVVGPPVMMKFAVAELLKLGMKEEQIWISQERKMCCGLGKCGHCRMNDTYICLDGPVFCYSEGKKLFD